MPEQYLQRSSLLVMLIAETSNAPSPGLVKLPWLEVILDIHTEIDKTSENASAETSNSSRSLKMLDENR